MLIKNYTLIFISFILILSVFIIGINSFLPNKFLNNDIKFISSKKINIFVNKMADQYRIIEYPLIILFCLTGAVFLMSSSDIVSIFLSLELQSYGLYLISSIYRNSESSISAGLTYFLLGGLSSCIILLGISLLYINTGNTNLENIYMINSISNAFTYNILYENLHDSADSLWVYKYMYMQYTYMQLPLTIISIGLLFKIAAAPFHFWSPDVYDAIPTIVTTFVAIIAKVSLLILLLELILYTEDNVLTYSWSNNIILSSILSLFIGSVLGLVQHRIKRLYAYSTISHVGFILLALSINTLESTRAFFFYIIQYSLSNLNAFIILITIGYSLYFYYHKDGYYVNNNNYSPIQYISQLKGYFYINPVIAISLGITLFSFIGVPPLVGFFGKQMILSTALDNGYLYTTLIAILTSVVSAVYYLVIVKVIFFEKEDYKFDLYMFSNLSEKLSLNDINNLKSKSISSYLSLSISILTLLILFFMFYDQEIIRLLYII
jgi:NADH-ubiquinone oxidoreductase chain 2